MLEISGRCYNLRSLVTIAKVTNFGLWKCLLPFLIDPLQMSLPLHFRGFISVQYAHTLSHAPCVKGQGSFFFSFNLM
ncbi:hypothetical protein AMELA_G00023140 [Ameiurus melas]|uniref:Uncharacterized protein n=1 Tax=Ameiurus melas TaxID=219545 RepID=A0A7J6BDK5_AMEME|nr:hypothetical protein AMELA_G00023140 [Ameiurus melas]